MNSTRPVTCSAPDARRGRTFIGTSSGLSKAALYGHSASEHQPASNDKFARSDDSEALRTSSGKTGASAIAWVESGHWDSLVAKLN